MNDENMHNLDMANASFQKSHNDSVFSIFDPNHDIVHDSERSFSYASLKDEFEVISSHHYDDNTEEKL